MSKIKNIQAELGQLRTIWLNLAKLVNFDTILLQIYARRSKIIYNFLEISLRISFFPLLDKIDSLIGQNYDYLAEFCYFQCLKYF